MTIKTGRQASSLIIKASKSDMQKRGAVKNLFGTAVDREDLRQQLEQNSYQNNQKLQNYEVQSLISVIGHSANYRPRKKKPSRRLESEDENDDQRPRIESTREPLSSNGPSSSSSSATKTPIHTSSNKKSDVKLIQEKVPLAKGQKTLKGEWGSITIANGTFFQLTSSCSLSF